VCGCAVETNEISWGDLVFGSKRRCAFGGSEEDAMSKVAVEGRREMGLEVWGCLENLFSETVFWLAVFLL
jgi:hypothetical protein